MTNIHLAKLVAKEIEYSKEADKLHLHRDYEGYRQALDKCETARELAEVLGFTRREFYKERFNQRRA